MRFWNQIVSRSEEEFINTIYGQCPNVSIDFGILEKSNQVYVLQGSFGWSDVGTWHALFFEFELFFKIPDFFFVFAVADHQVVVFGCNNQVIDPIDDGYFPLRDINEAIATAKTKKKSGILKNNSNSKNKKELLSGSSFLSYFSVNIPRNPVPD